MLVITEGFLVISMFCAVWLTESKYAHLPYRVSRTKNHMLPVYIRQTEKTTVKFTHVGKISGDIWVREAGSASF